MKQPPTSNLQKPRASRVDIAARAAGVLVGTACGDALGVPYEFAPKVQIAPSMRGGGMGPYRAGEWSDDTQLAVALAEVAVTGANLQSKASLDNVAERMLRWLKAGATDVDSQTRVILQGALDDETDRSPAHKVAASAAYFHKRTGRSAGNGILPRAGVLGLTRVHSRQLTSEAARAVSCLTHPDPLAGDAVVLWAEAVRYAVTAPAGSTWAGRINIEGGIDLLPLHRQKQWRQWVEEALERYFAPPSDNTYVVSAFQAALGAIAATALEEVPLKRAFAQATSRAVQAGGDTDTVAAAVGALMGAVVGASNIPPEWVKKIHGWPGLRATDLHDMGAGIAIAGIVGQKAMAQALAGEIDLEGDK
ncbi:MAG: ADP-ribosylglycohydrolase family protein [Winkia neuii]|nr:ADP-ribosylglycohydrolase family protein [Winkia neuii]OFJ69541.1 hypothetical protein HMPREF2851_01150 [Actinomyces sp. HMSC064C12]OFK01515.1 hypothetical protein HMPREF2835_02255 [Actinomyces sp. HMSC072A03]OFT55065.1 hypothetical protein HMPREF3152_06915 [Actinomyces sp. HMSC06A08]MDK8100037.1 ADP-ribosylglycohydrolase family protein [Winkia neuii]MDU3135344.1 ADP-ribosylglycohydrolase family protein [Winkia neuii]